MSEQGQFRSLRVTARASAFGAAPDAVHRRRTRVDHNVLGVHMVEYIRGLDKFPRNEINDKLDNKSIKALATMFTFDIVPRGIQIRPSDQTLAPTPRQATPGVAPNEAVLVEQSERRRWAPMATMTRQGHG